MDCPHYHFAETTKLQRKTALGYDVFRCRRCGCTFNERTGTPFSYIEVPTGIVFQMLLNRVRDKLSYRDVAELFLLRGFMFTHETVREREERFGPMFTDELRAKRQGKMGKIRYVDETYVKVKGRRCYLYRAIHHDSSEIGAQRRSELVIQLLNRHEALRLMIAFGERQSNSRLRHRHHLGTVAFAARAPALVADRNPGGLPAKCFLCRSSTGLTQPFLECEAPFCFSLNESNARRFSNDP